MGIVMFPALKNDEVKQSYVALGTAMKDEELEEVKASLIKLAKMYCPQILKETF